MIKAKLIEAAEALDMNQGEFGDFIGYSKALISAVANGHREPTKTLDVLLDTVIETTA